MIKHSTQNTHFALIRWQPKKLTNRSSTKTKNKTKMTQTRFDVGNRTFEDIKKNQIIRNHILAIIYPWCHFIIVQPSSIFPSWILFSFSFSVMWMFCPLRNCFESNYYTTFVAPYKWTVFDVLFDVLLIKPNKMTSKCLSLQTFIWIQFYFVIFFARAFTECGPCVGVCVCLVPFIMLFILVSENRKI